jgi:hypothetical protein
MANESNRIPHSPARAGVEELSESEMNRIAGGTPNTPPKEAGTNKVQQYLELELTNVLLSGF